MNLNAPSQLAVLFVCLGNICRSPMAEGALRAAMERLGVDIMIDSAGTAAYHVGSPPDPRAIAAAKIGGVNIAGQFARQIEAADFHRFTHVVALDKANLEGIRSHQPRNGTAQIGLLLDWLPGYEGQGVADPYYGGEAEFAAAWSLITRATQALCRQLYPFAR